MVSSKKRSSAIWNISIRPLSTWLATIWTQATVIWFLKKHGKVPQSASWTQAKSWDVKAPILLRPVATSQRAILFNESTMIRSSWCVIPTPLTWLMALWVGLDRCAHHLKCSFKKVLKMKIVKSRSRWMGRSTLSSKQNRSCSQLIRSVLNWRCWGIVMLLTQTNRIERFWVSWRKVLQHHCFEVFSLFKFFSSGVGKQLF